MTNSLLGYFLCCCLCVAGFSQSVQHEFICGWNKYVFPLPADFKEFAYHYTEGDYRFYYRSDTVPKEKSVRFVIHCGSSIGIPHLRDSTFIVENSDKYERSGHQLNGLSWRELNLDGGLNIYYKNAGSEDQILLDSVIDRYFSEPPTHPLTTTQSPTPENLYSYAVKILLDSIVDKYSNSTFIVEGEGVSGVRERWVGYDVLIADKTHVFKENGTLHKEYKYLIGMDLIRFWLRDEFIDDSRLKIPIVLRRSLYESRRKSHSELFGDALWMFVFKFQKDTQSFILEEIETGITL